jgi:prophage regulatory protein
VPENVRILRYAQLKPEKDIPWSRPHLDRLEKKEEFPRRVRLGPGTIGWLESEIDQWLADSIAKRTREKPSL